MFFPRTIHGHKLLFEIYDDPVLYAEDSGYFD